MLYLAVNKYAEHGIEQRHGFVVFGSKKRCCVCKSKYTRKVTYYSHVHI